MAERVVRVLVPAGGDDAGALAVAAVQALQQRHHNVGNQGVHQPCRVR